MSYRNTIRTPDRDFWYTVYLRNWNAMGETMQSNLNAGPCFEIVLDGYLIAAGGSTVEEAVEAMESTLAMYRRRGSELPIALRPSLRYRLREAWSRFKWRRYEKRNPCCHPVPSFKGYRP